MSNYFLYLNTAHSEFGDQAFVLEQRDEDQAFVSEQRDENKRLSWLEKLKLKIGRGQRK